MPKQKHESGHQKRVEKKEREARSSTSAFFSKKGESIKLAVQVPCSCLGLSQLLTLLR